MSDYAMTTERETFAEKYAIGYISAGYRIVLTPLS
jgi:hypothetical protein